MYYDFLFSFFFPLDRGTRILTNRAVTHPEFGVANGWDALSVRSAFFGGIFTAAEGEAKTGGTILRLIILLAQLSTEMKAIMHG